MVSRDVLRRPPLRSSQHQEKDGWLYSVCDVFFFDMGRLLILASMYATLSVGILAAATTTNTLSTNRVLMIDPCFTRVAGGKATLTITNLRPRGDTYGGDY